MGRKHTQRGFVGIPFMRGRTRNSRPGGSGGGGMSGKRWSDSATWPGGIFPDANTTVNVPFGETYIIDTPSAVAADVQVFGTLTADPAIAGNKLTTGWIDVRGTGLFQVGASKVSRYAGSLDIEANGDLADSPTSLRYGVDQTGSTVSGDGRLTMLHLSIDTNVATATEVITVTATSAGGGTVSGSVSGSLGAWTLGTRFNNKLHFLPTGTFVNGQTVTVTVWQQGRKNNGTSRAINVHPGGILRLHGGRTPTNRVPLNANASAGANSFTLESAPSGWLAGDTLLMTGSTYQDVASGQAQTLVLQSQTGAVINTGVTTLAAARWGAMQYVTDAGMSLTAGTLPEKPPAMSQVEYDAIPKTLDERARVANLTRSIRIYAPNDSAWSTDGFGVHIMRHPGALVEIDGVEMFRCGQRGNFGRYPIHLHCGSYQQPYGMSLPSNGVLIGDVADYVENCVVRDSSQRGIVLHMVKGATVKNNVLHNIDGHMLFMEDGSETGNIIHDNIIVKSNDVLQADALILSDVASPSVGQGGGASGLWLAHPSNDVQRNEVFQAAFVGIWNAFGQSTPLGLSREIATIPGSSPITKHLNNRASGCGRTPYNGSFNSGAAMLTGLSHINNRGELNDGNSRYGGTNDVRQVIEGAQLSFANQLYFNRVGTIEYRGWTSSNTQTWCFVGAASNIEMPGLINRCLGVGWSLNNATLRNTYPRWMTSYHELLNAQNNLIVNFPAVAPSPVTSPDVGGGIIGGDFYTASMFSLTEFMHLICVNAAPMFRPKPPHIDGAALANRHWTTAGAIQDANGTTGIPAGQFRVFDHPFLTFGLPDAVALTPASLGEYRTAVRHYGVIPIINTAETNEFSPRLPMNCDRLDPGNLATVVGQWNVADGNTSISLVFRSFSAAKDGIYKMTWPTSTNTFSTNQIEFLTQSTDSFVIAVEQNGAPTAVFTTTRTDGFGNQLQPPVPTGGHISAGEARNFSSVASIAAVIASGGESYFYESGTNLLWARVRGGLNKSGNYSGGLLAQQAKPLFFVVKSN